MIKLSNILNEISITRGEHLGVRDSLRVLDNVLYNAIGLVQGEGITDDIKDGKYKTYKSLDIPKLLAKVKPITINVSGNSNLIVYRYTDSGSDTYVMFNTKAPAESCCVGFIEASRISGKFKPYSPNATFNISGVVHRVHMSEVAKEYMGKGYGSLLYNAVWDDSAAICSDSILFKGSFTMWTKKILSEADFFGVLIGRDIESDVSNGIIIPLTAEQAVAEKVVGAAHARNYIAVKGEVPQPIRKVANNLKGINPATELTVNTFTESIKTTEFEFPDAGGEEGSVTNGDIFDLLDTCDSLLDMFEKLDDQRDVYAIHKYGNDYSKKTRVAIFLFNDATLIVKDLGTGKLINVLV